MRTIIGFGSVLCLVAACAGDPQPSKTTASAEATRFLKACLDKLEAPVSSALGVNDAKLEEVSVTELSGPADNQQWPKTCSFIRTTGAGANAQVQFLFYGENGSNSLVVSGKATGAVSVGASLTTTGAIKVNETTAGTPNVQTLTDAFVSVADVDEKNQVTSLAIVPESEGTQTPAMTVGEDGETPTLEDQPVPNGGGTRHAVVTAGTRAAEPASYHAFIMARRSDFVRAAFPADNVGPASFMPFAVAMSDVPKRLWTGVELAPQATLPEAKTVYGPDPNGVRLCGAALMDGYNAWFRAGIHQYGYRAAYYYNGQMWHTRSHYPDTYAFVFRMPNLVPAWRRTRDRLPKYEMDFTCVLPKETSLCWKTMPEKWDKTPLNHTDARFLRYEVLSRNAARGVPPNAYAVGSCLQNYDRNPAIQKLADAKNGFRMPLVLTNDGYQGWNVAAGHLPVRIADITSNTAFAWFMARNRGPANGPVFVSDSPNPGAASLIDWEPFWVQRRSARLYEATLLSLAIPAMPGAYSWNYVGTLIGGPGRGTPFPAPAVANWPAQPGDPIDVGISTKAGQRLVPPGATKAAPPVFPVRLAQRGIGQTIPEVFQYFASTANDEYWSFPSFSLAPNLNLTPGVGNMRGVAINTATNLFLPYKNIFLPDPLVVPLCPVPLPLLHPKAATRLGMYAISFGWAGTDPNGRFASNEYVTQIQILISDVDLTDFAGAGKTFTVAALGDGVVPGLDPQTPGAPAVAYARTVNIRGQGATGFQPTGGDVKVTSVGTAQGIVHNVAFRLTDGVRSLQGTARFSECSGVANCLKPLADARDFSAPVGNLTAQGAGRRSAPLSGSANTTCPVPPPVEVATNTPVPLPTLTDSPAPSVTPSQPSGDSPTPRAELTPVSAVTTVKATSSTSVDTAK